MNPYKGKNSPEIRWHQWVIDIVLEHHVPIYRFEDINSPKAIDTIKSLAPDIIVVVYYDQILKRGLSQFLQKDVSIFIWPFLKNIGAVIPQHGP